jgi:MerR family transcriptional regulator/heat shock protein HspR
MKYSDREPVYTIGIAAKMLKVCTRTLRIWEGKGLVKPSRLGKNRFYSKCDIERLEKIKELLQKKRINIEGVKSILNTTKCWEVKRCKPNQRAKCPIYIKYGNA